MKSHKVLHAVVLSLVATICAGPNSTSANLRKVAIGDAKLVGVDTARAKYIVDLDHTWVATKDIRTKPACKGPKKFIVVSKSALTGQWLGGNPGCQVIELARANGVVEFAFNPYCQWVPELVSGSCLKLPKTVTSKAAMMARLQPARWSEVIGILNLYYMPEDGELQIPASVANWFVVEGSRPFVIAPLFHDEALNIIVPNGVKLGGGQIGHSRLYLNQEGPYGDPLCQAVQLHGISALPLKFSGSELEYIRRCER